MIRPAVFYPVFILYFFRMESPQAVTPSDTQATDDAALTIYDGLSNENFSTVQKLDVLRALKGLIVSDIDESIKQLQRLKTPI